MKNNTPSFDSFGIHHDGETVRVGPHAREAMFTYTEEGKEARLRVISEKHGALYVSADGEIVKRPLLDSSEKQFLQLALIIEDDRHTTRNKIHEIMGTETENSYLKLAA